MTERFLEIVNLSISAGWLVLAVLVLRLVLKRAPKWVNVLLWGLVAVRLLCPFSMESALSLIPSAETFPEQVISGPSFDVQTGIAPVDDRINEYLGDRYFEGVTVPANNGQNVMTALSVVWIIGMGCMAAYTLISYLRLRRRTETAVRYRDNIFRSENVRSPFVLGIILPRIYLPYHMDPQDMEHVIAHEQAHIRRKDHWWKPLGFLLLTIHWFNPLMWVAYVLLCRDIELACDEKVIAALGQEQRADYSQALVACSVDRRSIAACPLAFGEVGVKERVKSILHYRRPGFWLVAAAVAVCGIVAVCFLTDPKPVAEFAMKGENVADLYPAGIVEKILRFQDIENSGVYMNADNFSLTVDSDFNWYHSQTVQYFFYENNKIRSAQLRIFPEEREYFLTESREWVDQNRIFLLRHYLDALKFLPQEELRRLAPADLYLIELVDEGSPSGYDRVVTYSGDGVGETDGWYIHLRVLPQHADGEGFSGTGEEEIHLFYGESYARGAERWYDYRLEPELMDWNGERVFTIDEFPGVSFHCTPYQITDGEQVLISGMPIWSAYLLDLNGDGYPEICSETSFGSGLIDNRIEVYDYANGVAHSLERRMLHDYHLWRNDSDGQLYADKKSFFGGGLVYSGRLVIENGSLKILGEPEANHEIVNIVDPTRDPNFASDSAMEKFFEDDANEYFFSGVYSQYVIVHYADGTSEDIVSALANGRATLTDLDRFGVRYWAEQKEDKLEAAISRAILDHYASDQPDGLIHVESHVLLANEVMSGTPVFSGKENAEQVTVYLLVHHVKYSTYGGALEAVGGSYVPAAITFRVSENGDYTLEEYWEPRDGGLYADDIRAKFPGASAEDALNEQAYLEELKAETYRKATDYLNKYPSLDQRIGELLGMVEQETEPDAAFQELMGYGEFTLRYCFTEFLQGVGSDHRGQIMAQVCRNILLDWGEGYAIDFDPVSGQAWFTEFQANAQSLSRKLGPEELAKHYPGALLLLQMTEGELALKHTAD